MAIANTSIKLDVHEPKKNAVTTQLAPVPAATEVAIWVPTGPNTGFISNIVLTLQDAHAWAQSHIKDGAVIVALDIGGGDNDIVLDTAPTAGQVGIYMGTDVVTKQQSHFLDRTFKRLIERWLEESK